MNGCAAHEVTLLSLASWRRLASPASPADGAPVDVVALGPRVWASNLYPTTRVLEPIADRVVRVSSGDVFSATVDLGIHSEFYGLKGRRFFGTGLDSEVLNAHHHADNHDYVVRAEALKSSRLISVAEVRPHRSAGLAASLGNLLNLSANENLYPRYSVGTPKTGGDTFPESSLKYRIASSLLWHAPVRLPTRFAVHRLLNRSQLGAWEGNDTLWRSILDLVRVATYARSDGVLADKPQREVAASVALPGSGSSSSVSSLIVAGRSAVAVDLVCARLCGFEWKRIPYLRHAFDDHDLPLVDFGYQDIEVVSEFDQYNRRLTDVGASAFVDIAAPQGWTNLKGAR